MITQVIISAFTVYLVWHLVWHESCFQCLSKEVPSTLLSAFLRHENKRVSSRKQLRQWPYLNWLSGVCVINFVNLTN